MDSKTNAQREQTRRGFSISHQKVVLEIDFSGCFWGYTEITIVPTSSELRTIHLHSRQCTIHTVTVASLPAEFIHHDPLSNISVGAPDQPLDCHRHPELKRKLYSALQESEEGELSIAIPVEVALKYSGNTVTREVATPEPQASRATPQAQAVPEFAPIAIHIAYSLRNPADGFQFVTATESYPYRVPHAYTTPSSPDAARCWVPCIDNLWEKCTWEFEFVVPRYLEEIPLDEDQPIDASPTLVVCSGELVEQVAHPHSSHKTIFLFSQAVLTSVQHIAFAAGPFHMYSIPLDHIADDGTSTQPPMYAFCLPGHESLLTTSTVSLRSAMSFYASDFGSYPFGSYKLVFVDEMPTQRFDSSTLTIFSNDFLHGEDAIEQSLETRHALCHALACQWVGINIQPRAWSDTWLVNGLALYITGLFMKKLLGNNEYRFRLKKDMQRVAERDRGLMPPICQPTKLEPPDELPFINLKAPLVLHILDRKLGKSGTSLGLSRVLPKIFLSALTGESNTISTHMFLRTCRKVSGVDPRTFADQWIYGSGCPSFGFSASFNRKKMAVEITMRQDCPAYTALEKIEHTMVLYKPVACFEGQMTVRIHEADGTPYEHVLDIQSGFKRYEVPFNTKYKRVRRNTKRYLARQAAAQAAAEGDTEAAEAMGMVDMGFGLEIWEKESERNNWKVEDWTEEDETAMSGATYEWIRMDADFEWIATLKFEQPDFMWVSQLQRDRDVVAQLEALHALAQQPTAIVSSTLTKTVLVSNYFYRIRCEAALALVNCSIPKLKYLGLFHLFKLFLRYCYDPENPNQDLFAHTYVPKPNDFSDLSEYFVRKSLINAISRIRFENGKTPSVVRKFLIDQLRYNDNTSNTYADGYYICTIISSAAYATVSTSPPERGELLPSEVRSEYNEEDADLLKQALAEVDRYRTMDRLIPSTHNNVTIAALEFYTVLMVSNLIPSAPLTFFPLTRQGNYTQVRIAAFDGLFLTKWYTPSIMHYVLAVMAHDPSRIIRRHVARSASTSLALLVQMGEMKSLNSKETEVLIEEDGSVNEKNKESRKSELESMLKALRKDKEVGKNEIFRELMMPLALDPSMDHQVRWCLLKMADLLIKPVEETLPTVTVKIHIPVTPTIEAPPQPLPKVRPLRLAGPTPSPVIPNHVPKLKLVASTPRASTPNGAPAAARTPRIASAEPQTKAVTFAVPAVPPKAKQQPKAKPPKPNGVAIHATAKPAPPRAAPRAQAAGMSVNDLRATRSALKKLQANKHAKIFLHPVDPLRDHAPNYFDVIKDPIDLGTMSHKLEQGKYADRFAFQADFGLMMSNAKAYNPVGTYAHNETLALETFFEKQWSIINKTLEAAHAKEASRRPPPPPAPPVSRAPDPTPSTSRQTIKLKAPQPKEAGPEQVAKPPRRKPKVEPLVIEQEPPDEPPPYVDDGSHDILQEVLALEEEQKSKHEKVRQRSVITNGSKRKKMDISEEEEEDILALAKPVKRGRASPPPPTASSSSSSTTIPKIVLKAKPPAEPPSEIPRIPSVKGKEKEVRAASAAPTRPRKAAAAPVSQEMPINEKKCKQLLQMLMKLTESAIFLRPVDPLIDGCPTYLEEIAHPMDFGTISQNLSAQVYETMEDFKRDVDLVFNNCRTFNPPATFPWECAEAVEKVFKKEWPKAMERKLSAHEKRGLQGILKTIGQEQISWIFLEPVNPVVLGIPTYFDVIKEPRDLKTIGEKLKTDKYDTVEAFQADIKLMLDNALLFNGAESEVGVIATTFGERFQTLFGNWKAAQGGQGAAGGSKKRKDGEKASVQPTKKMRVG
ncbi:hypothetical protein FB45DRAFT_329816 [Roridomyces roridus]|uniref:Transcription initiation factor TFIID subunit 2 n=1 Tax=Roridomyces roridus TaxID=1738132 RepID=A0AAD7B5C3_9AGAR|nr:hypothetical protein FB45DRAFT_329816 [Roridomyces roridus]